MTPLAEIVYDILRQRTAQDDPRITYAELAEQVRDAGDEFEYITHRSRPLYAALSEVGAECLRLAAAAPAGLGRARRHAPARRCLLRGQMHRHRPPRRSDRRLA